MELFKVKDLSFSYPSSEKKALENIELSVLSGEFITVCGLSGSGKSTLLRQLKTALCPYGIKSGTVLYKNESIDKIPDRVQAEEIGFVMQSPDNQTVTDKVWHELSFGLENIGTDEKTIRRKTAETASFFGMESWYHKSINELSGGQKQILNLACVMITSPKVLILDEPVSQLDPIASEEFMNLLIKINRELGTAVIMSEHNLENVFAYSSRVIIMSNGKIISDLSPEKTVLNLYNSNLPIKKALPISAKLHMYFSPDDENIPFTVSDGRKMLSEYIAKNNIKTDVSEKHDKTDNKDPVLELKEVFFRYDRSNRDILKGTNLKVRSGEVFSIIGGNGSGKTTLLKTVAGYIKQYSGKRKLKKGCNCVYLPQNPQALFIEDSVREDLRSAVSGIETDKSRQEKDVLAAAHLCGIAELLDRHPYDLSGGEQQKAVLAKILLTKPDIILMDEPVKGMDVCSKEETGRIIRFLAEKGKTIVLVSHDMEFCAKYSDRCSLLFDGQTIGTGDPYDFFCGNGIYTTVPRRLTKGIIDNCITEENIWKSLGVYSEDENNVYPDVEDFFGSETEQKEETKTKIIKKNNWSMILLSVLFAISAIGILSCTNTGIGEYYKPLLIIASVISSLAIVIFGFAAEKKQEKIKITKIKRSGKSALITLSVILLFIPITIFAGIYFLNDTKYIFISLLIMLECILPFFVMFEKRHIKTREIVLIAVMSALCVISRAVFYMLPEFKPLTAMVIISGAALGGESGFLIGSLSMLSSNVIFGQGPWTPWQMFAMGLIGLLSGTVLGRKKFPKNSMTFASFGFLCVLIIYGGIMNPAAAIMSHIELTPETAAAYYAAGLPLDLIHALSTALFLFIGSHSLIKKLERVKRKYGLISVEEM